MAVDFGTGYIDVEPRVDKTAVQSTITRDLGSSLKSAGKKMAVAGAGLTAGVTLPLALLGKEAISLASNFEDVTAAATVTFGKKAVSDVQAWADEALQSFGITEGAALDAATNFAAFGKSAGLAGTDLADFSTDMVGLAGDLASFRGTSVEEALAAVGSGLRGEAEPLRKYGILLDDATLRARAFAEGIVKSTDEALTPQQKVLAAQAEILAQTGDAQGDFARTSDSTANKLKVLTGSFTELLTEIGTALLPVVQKVAGFIGGLVAKFSALSPTVKTIIVVLAGLAAAAGPVLVVVGAIVGAIGSITAVVGPAVAAAGGLGAALGGVVAAALPVVAAIAAVIAVGYLVIKNWDAIKAALQPLIDLVGGLFLEVWNALKEVWEQSILPALRDLWEAVKALWPIIKVLLVVALAPVVAAFIVLMKVLPVVLKLLGFLIRIAASLVRGIAEVVAWVGDKLGGAFTAVLGIGKRLFEDFKRGFQSVKDVVLGVWDAIKEGWDTIIDGIKTVWNNTVGGFGFTVPDWIPGIGGKEFRIPELARGGVVERPTVALIGEAGPEAVVPLDRVASVASAGRGQVITGTLQLTPDSEVFIRGVASDEDDVRARRVRSAARLNPKGRAVA